MGLRLFEILPWYFLHIVLSFAIKANRLIGTQIDKLSSASFDLVWYFLDHVQKIHPCNEDRLSFYVIDMKTNSFFES